MAVCSACGAEIDEKARFCPCCGAEIQPADDRPLKDYWAERIAQGDLPDWVEETEEKEILDLEEESPPAKAKTAKRKRLPFMLILCMVLAAAAAAAGIFWAFYEKQPFIPGSGLYYSVSVSKNEHTEQREGDFADLRPDGTIRLRLIDTDMEGRWKLEGRNFSCFLDHRTMKGSLEKGVLSFDYAGARFLFALPEQRRKLKTQDPEILVSLPEEPYYTAWFGDYYGTMLISDGTGAWQENSGECLDICGRIKGLEEESGRILLFNRYNKPGEHFLIADILFSEGTREMGKFSVSWGKLYDMELGPGEWVVDPGKSPFSMLNGMCYFRGTYIDPQDPGDSFVYEIFLKPWGEGWEDAEGSADCAYILPPGYYDWYLPLKNAGQRMPDFF